MVTRSNFVHFLKFLYNEMDKSIKGGEINDKVR